jgi:hypothetical protein
LIFLVEKIIPMKDNVRSDLGFVNYFVREGAEGMEIKNGMR